MKQTILLKLLAAVALTAATSYSCTITPAVAAAQMARVVRAGLPPVTSVPFYIPVSVLPGCTLEFEGLFNAYPLVETLGPRRIDQERSVSPWQTVAHYCPSSRSMQVE